MQDIDAAHTEAVQTQLQQLGVTGCITTAAAPVQYEGAIDGNFLYFRARGDKWEVQICPTDNDLWTEKVLYRKQGCFSQNFDASWMPHAQALEFILQCVEEFLAIG